MQMATLASTVTDVLVLRALSAPSAAEGCLRYSAGYRYRSAAARLVGMEMLTVLVAILTAVCRSLAIRHASHFGVDAWTVTGRT